MFQPDRQRRLRSVAEGFFGHEYTLAREPVGLIVRRVNEPARRAVCGDITRSFAEERPGLNAVCLVVRESVFEGDFAALRGDFAALRGDFAALRGDFAALRGDFARLRVRLRGRWRYDFELDFR